MNRRPDPLTPEERVLADRLAKIAPVRVPSGDIDARILRAGRDAAAATRRSRPPRRRWPAMAGLAATLALAIGVAWQLRPVAEAPMVQGEAPVADAVSATEEVAVASRMRNTGETSQVAPAVPAASAARAVASPMAVPAGSPSEDAAVRPMAKRLTPPPASRADVQPAIAAAPETGTEVPTTLRAAAAAPPPPPHPAPPAPPAPSAGDRSAAQAEALRASREREPATQRSSPATVIQARRSAAAAVQSAPRPTATLTVTDLPVTSDAGLAPAVWIERIRQRRDGGGLAGALVSLEQLRATHPDVVLPDDLCELAGTTAPTAP